MSEVEWQGDRLGGCQLSPAKKEDNERLTEVEEHEGRDDEDLGEERAEQRTAPRLTE